MNRLIKLLVTALASLSLTATAHAAGGALHPHSPDDGWTFDGYMGKFDQAQLQRGYKVYREVCAACHSMDLLHFRNLGDKGGPFFDDHYPNPNDNPIVKQLAADSAPVEIINEETGRTINPETDEPYTRTRLTADPFPNPYTNPAQARYANNGALPPDLSVINKARVGGADYVYSLLTGYPSAEDMEKKYGQLEVTSGQYFNPYFPGDVTANWSGDPRHRKYDGSDKDNEKVPSGGFLAMAPPLIEDQVSFDDGTVATVDQMAKDVTAFLQWAAEPKATMRKQLGLGAMIYLLILTIIVYLSYRQIWRKVEH